MNHDRQADKGKPAVSKETPQHAMADYFDDLLGHIKEDPLAKRRAEEARAQAQKVAVDARQQKSAVKPKAKNQVRLAEPEPRLVKPVVAPAVIPAAFPKLAPAAPKQEELPKTVQAKPQEVEKQETQTDVVLPTKQEPPVTPKADIVAKPKVEQKPVISKPEPRVTIRQEPKQAAADAPAADEAFSEGPTQWLENGRPPWAQERFECLLFSVAGLKLAVPLVSLGAIYKIEKEFTPLVGRAKWFMGLYQATDRNVRVVDTARWVMPDRYYDGLAEKYGFIIRLGGNNWGMACDEVYETIQLEPSKVKWRTERSKRAWLSGTVIDHMCALLDADTLSYMLQKDIRKT